MNSSSTAFPSSSLVRGRPRSTIVAGPSIFFFGFSTRMMRCYHVFKVGLGSFAFGTRTKRQNAFFLAQCVKWRTDILFPTKRTSTQSQRKTLLGVSCVRITANRMNECKERERPLSNRIEHRTPSLSGGGKDDRSDCNAMGFLFLSSFS